MIGLAVSGCLKKGAIINGKKQPESGFWVFRLPQLKRMEHKSHTSSPIINAPRPISKRSMAMASLRTNWYQTTALPLRKAGVGDKCVQHALGAVVCP
jgi:hypothetical protein